MSADCEYVCYCQPYNTEFPLGAEGWQSLGAGGLYALVKAALGMTYLGVSRRARLIGAPSSDPFPSVLLA